MMTSLAHYQLPRSGVTTLSLATEIGADQRSLLLRPVTGTGGTPSGSWPATVEVKTTSQASKDHRSWLARAADYRDAARAAGSSAHRGETGS